MAIVLGCLQSRLLLSMAAHVYQSLISTIREEYWSSEPLKDNQWHWNGFHWSVVFEDEKEHK